MQENFPKPKLKVGRFEIHRLVGHDGIWIRDGRTGEGGAFPEGLLEGAIERFFEEYF